MTLKVLSVHRAKIPPLNQPTSPCLAFSHDSVPPRACAGGLLLLSQQPLKTVTSLKELRQGCRALIARGVHLLGCLH
ncbi:hypothetical protein SKAU_G00013940 [Synaphobranchus kaupii]|uniref:Uncharacterized protein n=1 Tax=Synaphobranchus kaupii TaxID=118154 RepID=A0A9Q1GBQ9_SYNKA|nr:hypothetical protein SKAU_G00013940 [Synaphobranchus kaupii]